MDKMGKKAILLVRILLIAVMLTSAGIIVSKLLDYRKGAKDYGEAAEIAQGGQASAELPPEETDAYAAMLAELDLAALREVNDEVVGWIAIPDTEVYYPILQTSDNDYYLKHTWKKEKSSVGAVFMEYRDLPDFSGFHSMLYGHQMRDGSMFGGLHKYADEEYLREHPAIYIVTDAGVQKYDIFAAYEVGVQEVVYQRNIEEKGLQQELIDFVTARAVGDAGAALDADSHILTLSTCTGRGYETRWVVQAALSE